MRNLRRRALSSSMLMSLACLSAPAFAADGGDADNDDPNIVVTGIRETEGLKEEASNGALGKKTLLDTPFSVTIVDAEDISKRQATTIAKIFANDPSVFSFASAGTVNWWGTQIRGLPVRNYYVDDVPMLLYWGGDLPLESIENVEALKGLTGFMYGFGAPGGAISYRTKRPTAEPLLTTEIGWRNPGDVYGQIDAGGPLNGDGSFGYRVNLAGEKGTTYNDAQNNRWLASLALEYRFSNDLKWHATATYEDSKLKREPFHIYWDSYEDGPVLPKVTYDYDNLNVANSFYKTRLLAIGTGLDWDFAKDWSLKLNYGFTSKLHNSNKAFASLINQAGDYDGGMYNFAALDRNHFVQAMVQGEFHTGSIRHEVVAGASFMANSYKPGIDWYFGSDAPGNIYQDQTFLVTRTLDFTLDSPSREKQFGIFASDTIHIGDHIQILAGLRRSTYKLVDTDGDPTVDSSYKVSATTPSLALIVKPAPYVSIYGSYVESLEAGSRITDPIYANIGEVLPATISKQYEAGIKFDHGALTLTGAGFRIERVNTADRFLPDANGDGQPDRYLRQDGLAVYQGVELIASYRVSRDLKLGAGLIRLDPKLRDVSEDIDPVRPVLPGNIPAEASKWQVTGNAEYAFAGIPGLSVHGNVRYFGKAPINDSNTLFIPGYTVANAGFQYETKVADRKVVFTGNVNNLFNKKYWGLQNFGEGINGSLSAKVFW